MHKSNPLLSILKNLKFPKLLLLSALIISSIGSIAGLLVPWFTGVNSGLKMLFYGGLKMSFFSGLRLSYI
ncbi:TPA: hypothetical protein OY038_002689 [Staphylococcus aureus]|nr:hypothetical protein [Staphylococcus aureus]